MSEDLWLTIIGWGEDGPAGLSKASHAALMEAEVIMGAKRHMALLPDTAAEQIIWPIPFSEGLKTLKTLRGRKTVVLASGDPFWFGAGPSITAELGRDEWRVYPGRSTFSLVAGHLGWRLEDTQCLGLHAAPMERIRPYLANGQKMILLLRDAEAIETLAECLIRFGFAQSLTTVLSSLGGPKERIETCRAEALSASLGTHPIAVALDCRGNGLPRTPGLPESFFDHDGQITKSPIRALTLAALAPRPNEQLLDIGGGSGSIAIEWLLSDPSTQAVSIESRPERAAHIRQNARNFGQDRLKVIESDAMEALEQIDTADAIFVGGGLSEALLETLAKRFCDVRFVVNAVTLESETILQRWHAKHGGALMRIEISNASPLGPRTGWKASYPIVQWKGVL